MTDKLDALVAQAIYEADSDGGYDPDDPRTFWMAEDGYWPPSEKMVVWDAWLRVADAAIAAMDQAQAAEIEQTKKERQEYSDRWMKAVAQSDTLEQEIERLREQLRCAIIDLSDLKEQVAGLVDTVNDKIDKWIVEAKQVLERGG